MTAIMLLLVQAFAIGGEELHFTGIAYHAQTGAFLYRENHKQQLFNGHPTELHTSYEQPDGKIFAKRWVSFDDSNTAPDFHFVDSRSGYAEGAVREDDGRVLYHVEPGAGERSETTVEEAQDLVVDVGFDRFVLQHWDALLAGETVEMTFAAPGRLKAVAFTMEYDGEEATEFGDAVTFHLDGDSWLVRQFVETIEFTYLKEPRALYRYRGPTNVRAPDGSKQAVELIFPPPLREERPASLLVQE